MMEKAVLVAQFDDLIRCYNVLLDNTCEKKFIDYVLNQEKCRQQWLECINECQRLKEALDVKTRDVSVIDSKLASARRWLDSERLNRKKAEAERNALAKQLEDVKRLLFSDSKNRVPDETKEKLSFLNSTVYDRYSRDGAIDRLNTISELDATDFSEASYTQSEDDLDDCRLNSKPMRKHRASFPDEEPFSVKRRRSSGPSQNKDLSINVERPTEKIVATTTVTIKHNGPMSAKSTIKSFSPTKELINFEQIDYEASPAEKLNFTPSAPALETSDSEEPKDVFKTPINPSRYESARDRLNTRVHSFVSKSVFMPESCLACDKKIKFGKHALKCSDCHAVSHIECRDKVPLPCIPMGTPSKPGVAGNIQDYTPLLPPMIPALVIHCINEVEKRGLTELGIYRIPGKGSEVRGLKDAFLRCKGAPDLSSIEDIHSVCGCLKDFLRSLQDKLIPKSEWATFANAVQYCQENNSDLTRVYQAISGLPQPNRDTLAFLILHLQRVAKSEPCKMPIENLARMFGPTVIGCPEVGENLYSEAQIAISIVEQLLRLPADYWSSYIVEAPASLRTPATLRNTPSTESLMRKTSRKFLSTPLNNKNKRYFDTPPTITKSKLKK